MIACPSAQPSRRSVLMGAGGRYQHATVVHSWLQDQRRRGALTRRQRRADRPWGSGEPRWSTMTAQDRAGDEPRRTAPARATGDVTLILSRIEQGEPQAAEQLLPLVYEELRKLAAAKMAQEKPDQTLQATALVHEAYIRLVDTEKVQHWDSPWPFLCGGCRGDAADSRRACPPQASVGSGRPTPAS